MSKQMERYYKRKERNPAAVKNKQSLANRKQYLKIGQQINAERKEKRRSRDGLEKRLYLQMVRRCRAVKRYHGCAPDFTYEQFLEFCKGCNLDALYADWKQSGFNRRYSPSVDRIDNNLGYSLKNIEIVTSSENSRRAHPYANAARNASLTPKKRREIAKMAASAPRPARRLENLIK